MFCSRANVHESSCRSRKLVKNRVIYLSPGTHPTQEPSWLLYKNFEYNFSRYSEGKLIQLRTDQTCSASLFEINPSVSAPQQVLGDAISLSTWKVSPWFRTCCRHLSGCAHQNSIKVWILAHAGGVLGELDASKFNMRKKKNKNNTDPNKSSKTAFIGGVYTVSILFKLYNKSLASYDN